MGRLSMAALGVAFIAMATVPTLPAQAARLEFNFGTQSGGTGSFILDTDTAPDPNPALFTNPDGSFTEGISYPSAISDFTFQHHLQVLATLVVTSVFFHLFLLLLIA